MQMKSQNPTFFYEFKKQRSVYLKEKEPEKKELYYKTYLRMIEKEKEEAEKKRRRAERLQKQFDLAKEEEFRAGKGSNMPL